MARGTEIDGFAEKLRLALGQANLSRAQLAQAAGVDKSVVARWLSGALRPADHALAKLSGALGAHLAGLSRGDWDLPPAACAARLGIPAAPADAAAERLGSLGLWVAEADSWSLQAGLDLAPGRFAGFRLFPWPDLNFTGDVGGIIGEIWRGPGGLGCRFRNGISPTGRRGPACATGPHRFVPNGGPGRNRTYGMFHLLGIGLLGLGARRRRG